jgi:hypothetical protein
VLNQMWMNARILLPLSLVAIYYTRPFILSIGVKARTLSRSYLTLRALLTAVYVTASGIAWRYSVSSNDVVGNRTCKVQTLAATTYLHTYLITCLLSSW